MSRRSRPEPYRSWDDVPLTVYMDDAVRISGKSASFIYREVEAGRFKPTPLPRVGRTSPICWSKDAWMEEYGGAYLDRQRPARARCFNRNRSLAKAS